MSVRIDWNKITDYNPPNEEAACRSRGGDRARRFRNGTGARAAASVHARTGAELSVRGQSRRITDRLGDRVDVQRARLAQYLCRRGSGVRGAAAHAVRERRRAGVDEPLVL